MTEIGALIDLDRYPLDQPDTAAYRAVVAAARDQLQDDGRVIIRNLVRPGAVEKLNARSTTASPRPISRRS